MSQELYKKMLEKYATSKNTVRHVVYTHYDLIEKGLNSGLTLKQIYLFLKDKNLISSCYSQFARIVRTVKKSRNSDQSKEMIEEPKEENSLNLKSDNYSFDLTEIINRKPNQFW